MAEKKLVKKVMKPKAHRCPIKEYVDKRLATLEDDIDNALNPLDRLDYMARYNEIQMLQAYMMERAVKGLISEFFEECQDDEEPKEKEAKA